MEAVERTEFYTGTCYSMSQQICDTTDMEVYMNQDNQTQGEMSLTRKVIRMGMLIHRYYEAKAQRHGATGDPLRGQGRVLALLKAKPETTQRELSYLLDMRQQSLSELLSKLEEKGFVTREKSAEDGRVTVVRLTDAGAEAAPSPNEMGENADALGCLDDDEQTQLETLTDKVNGSLEEKLREMGIDPYQGPRGPRPDRGHRDFDGRGRHGDRDRDGHGRHGDRDRDGRGHGFGGRDGRPHDDRGGRGGRNFDDRGGRGQRDNHSDRGGRGGQGYAGRGQRGPWRPDDDHGAHNMRQA